MDWRLLFLSGNYFSGECGAEREREREHVVVVEWHRFEREFFLRGCGAVWPRWSNLFYRIIIRFP